MRYLKHVKHIFYKRKVLPLAMTFFVTNKCNARCKHCFYWKELSKNKKILILEEIEKISKTMDDLILLILTGGEPFLRRDLPKIAEVFYKNNHVKNIVIPTNGLLTNTIVNYTEQIVKNCKKTHLTVYISLDDIDEKHDSFRGVKGIFKRAISTYKKLSKLKQKYSNLSVGILLTVNPLNQTRVLKIYNSIKKRLNPNFISPILMRSTSKVLNSKNVDIKHYDQLKNTIKKDILNKELSGHTNFSLSSFATTLNLIKHEIISKTVKEGYQIPCYAGLISATLYEDGSLFPCEMLNQKIGNLRDFNYDFRKIWFNEKTNRIRDYIKNSKCYCTYECAVDTNILFNPKILLTMFKEWELMRLTWLFKFKVKKR